MEDVRTRHLRACDLKIPEHVKSVQVGGACVATAAKIGLPTCAEELEVVRRLKERRRHSDLKHAGLAADPGRKVSPAALGVWEAARSRGDWCVRLTKSKAHGKLAREVAELAVGEGLRVTVGSARELLEGLKERFASHTADAWLRHLKTCKVLVISDLTGFRRGSWALETISGIILERKAKGLLTLIVCESDEALARAFWGAGEAWCGANGVLAAISATGEVSQAASRARDKGQLAPRRRAAGSRSRERRKDTSFAEVVIQTLEARLQTLERLVALLGEMVERTMPDTVGMAAQVA